MCEVNSCYNCGWATDKCKNKASNVYSEYLENIKACSINGVLDNSKEMQYKLNPEE